VLLIYLHSTKTNQLSYLSTFSIISGAQFFLGAQFY